MNEIAELERRVLEAPTVESARHWHEELDKARKGMDEPSPEYRAGYRAGWMAGKRARLAVAQQREGAGRDPNMDYEQRDAMLDVVKRTYAQQREGAGE